MKILRTIETFLPYVSGPAQQAYQISSRLEAMGISSPVLTSTLDIPQGLQAKDTIGDVSVTRMPVAFKFMRYAVTPRIDEQLGDCDVIHSHNYRNYQTDRAFFLPENITSLLS